MASSSPFDVVDIPDDDDGSGGGGDAGAAMASPPSSRKRSLAAASPSSADSLDAFSPSPPAPKRGLLATAPIDLDDTPPPPKRLLPSSGSMPPVISVLDDDDDDDDDEAGPSATLCSLVPSDDVSNTPDSVLLGAGFSETPGSAEPRFTGSDFVVPETPAFASPPSIGPPAAHGFVSAAPVQKSAGFPSVISLSDDESDEAVHRDSLTKLPSNTAGATSYGQPVNADLLHEDSTLPGAGFHTETYSSRELKEWQKEEKRKKQQEEKRLKKEEKAKLMEERKQKRQEMKAQVAEKKKTEKEVKKWESGKLALKCITAEINSSIVHSRPIGGLLLSSFAEKDLFYESTSNSTPGSIVWKMKIPDDIAPMISSLQEGGDIVVHDSTSVSEEIPYIVIVLQAEEFCDLVSRGSFFHHVQKVRDDYPTFTICYVINKLMSYINKREQSQFKNRSNSDTWRRPPVERVLCKLATHYVNVHSRQCRDEAEVAEHVVGLTKKPLTWLSVHANGSIIPKGFIDKNLAKKDTWFKSLIAIPGVNVKQAHAIWKQYRSMRSLLKVYMDPSKTDREKELLLSDLKTEDQLGNEGRRVGDKCSATVYKILMAEDGKMETNVSVAVAKSSRR
ncbi:hypothetical protein ACP4OV_025740 [Aristida adscensionis]